MLYEKKGWQKFFQFSQHNGKLPLPWRKQGNYPVIPIYSVNNKVDGADISYVGLDRTDTTNPP